MGLTRNTLASAAVVDSYFCVTKFCKDRRRATRKGRYNLNASGSSILDERSALPEINVNYSVRSACYIIPELRILGRRRPVFIFLHGVMNP